VTCNGNGSAEEEDTRVAIVPESLSVRDEEHVPGRSPIGPFVLGTFVGAIAGAVLGTALSPHARGFVVGLFHLINRRLTSCERDQLRFELLLQ
jgi:hypothetical protein